VRCVSACRCRLQLLNLLAAVHHQLHKHNLAALYLSTALNQHQEAQQQQQPKLPSSSKQEQQRKQQGKRQPKKQQQQQQGKAGAAEPAAGAAGGKEGAVGVSRQNHWLVQDNSDALYYNLGLQHLALQDWQAAMECFEAASCKFFTLPQLWLRWGEACIGLSHQQQQQLSSQQEVAAAVAAAAPAKGKLGAAKGGKGAPAGKKQQQQQQASSPQQLLQQAAAHLSTGLVILQEQQAAAAKQLEAATAAAAAALAAGEPSVQLTGHPWTASIPGAAAAAAAGPPADRHDTAGASSSSAAPASTSSPSSRPAAVEGGAAGPNTPTAAVGPSAAGPGMPLLSSWAAEAALLAPELAAVKQSLLANQAYVHLALNQPDEALAAALELVACSSMSPQQHYLGSTYAAEALCLLGRVHDAGLQLRNHMDMFPHGSSTMAGAVPAAAAATAAASTGGPAGIASSSSAAAGAAGAPDAGTTIAAAGSIKSYDGSCVSCARDACGHSGQWGSPEDQGGLGPQARAAALQNMAAVLLLQGDLHESQRHAVMAASLAAAAGQQDAASASGLLPSGGQGRGASF